MKSQKKGGFFSYNFFSKNHKEKCFVSFILIIFLVNFVSANFTIGNPSHEIETLYESGDAIIGWINISLNNELTGSILKSSLGGSMSLIDLINKPSNVGFVKTCDIINCVSGYASSNPATSKTLDLAENESVLIGFNIAGTANGLLTSITDFRFNLTSNNPETEKFPLAIDILNDGNYDWNAYTPSDNFGGENRGCFGVKTDQVNIAAQISYCERIRLSKTPSIELGAYVQGNTPGVYFSMKIDSVDYSQHGSCTTDPTVGEGAIERVSCPVPSFSVNNPGDYFVCIKASSSLDADKYKINIENDNNKCGFSSQSGSYGGSYNYDFDIFVRSKLYLGGINFILDDNELANTKSNPNIEGDIKNYISNVYGNNCSKGCVIPVKIFSGVGQQITLSNTYGAEPNIYIISYITDVSTTTDKFYNIAETPALISSGFQKLYLGESGFLVPLESGSKTVSITLNDSVGENPLFSEDISVGGSPGIKSLTPTRTGKNYPTLFTVILNATIKAAKYSWNFGDGEIKNTTLSEVTHTYKAIGSYMLKISLLDTGGTIVSSKEFNITVSPASQIVPELLIDAETKIDLIKIQMQDFSQFEQRAINYSLKINQTESDIARFKTSASKAGTTEVQFESILGELLLMKIPSSIAKTTYTDGMGFYPNVSKIDLNALRQASGGSYDANKSEQYKQAIFAWEDENINTVLFYQEISAIYQDYQESFLRTFDARIAKSGDKNAYIIIKDMGNMLFKNDYSQKKDSGYYSISLDSSEKNIVFSTTGNVDFINLPMFISPPINELSLLNPGLYEPGGQLKKWVIFSLIAIGIIFTALVAWVVLQLWYKRKYESYLFKNRNNLYNLVNYIQNEKNKGTRGGEIISKLRKTGWTPEQIKYALKKHAGKRTGMPEIPVEKFLKGKENKINK